MALKLGYKTHLDTRGYNPIGQIQKNSKGVYFRGGNLPINNAASADLARDKYATSYFLNYLGHPVPAFSILDRRETHDKKTQLLSNFIELHGCIYVKPNFGCEGEGVYKIDRSSKNIKDILISLNHHDIFLQQAEIGRSFRAVVLKGKLLLIYERLKPRIYSDGKSKVKDLIDLYLKRYHLSSSDSRISNCLVSQGIDQGQVLSKGSELVFLDNDNLSTGGMIKNIKKDEISEATKLALVRIAKSINLEFCAIDIIARDIMKKPIFKCLEVNSAPEFYWFAHASNDNLIEVENLYKNIFRLII